METSPDSPYIVAAIGAVLTLMSYRGVLRKKVRTISGVRTSSEAVYYLVITAYILGAILATVIAAMQFHLTRGWGALILYLLVVISASVFIHKFRSIARGILLGIKSLFTPKAKPPGPSPKTWALATVAIISRVKGMNYHLLGGAEPSERRAQLAQKQLSREWEIDNPEEFEEVLEWLFEIGHRTEFRDKIAKIAAMTPAQLEEYKTQFIPAIKDRLEKEEENHRVEMIQNNQGNVRNASFLAWDMLRFIDNCRTGFLAGYIDEEDAWNRILSAAQVLQSRFDSWQELSDSFLLGREFWSIVETNRDGMVYQKAYERLVEEEKSPWNKIIWDLPLYTRG
ncbi:MAG: DUF1266 domain-containing protein [Bacteroidia bacterium]|nr:DUF1266 domain-containing protein [Bacteroidia bacterium]